MMNCPTCGSVMVWLNGSVLHDPPVKQYECRVCHIGVTKYPDGTYDTAQIEQPEQQEQGAAQQQQ